MAAQKSLNSKVYFVLPADQELARLETLVRQAIAGGVGMIQYREKHKTTRKMVEEATRLRQITSASDVPLIINDRVDIALAVGADGVHVGAQDMPVALARRMLGPRGLIGATTPDRRSMTVAEQEGADYVAMGPVFASPTKPEKDAIGVETLHRRLKQTSLPVCAIGGINIGNAGQLAESRISLAAVVSAIADADDPAEAVRRLNEKLGEPGDQWIPA
ncbi:MAG: thiamine phosphate synthase [Armatimonadota bacterium]